MNERKTISINPELFSLSSTNTTRKKRNTNENKELKIKSANKQPHSTKTLRNRLLHYIRKNQEENFKKMHGSTPEITVPDIPKRNHITESFNNDFEESLKYMTEIADQVTQKVDNNYMINQTLRNYKSINPESILSNTNSFDKQVENLPQNPGISLYNDTQPISSHTSPMKLNYGANPSWGCMKGGTLPTYRLWKNQTQKHREPMSSSHNNHSYTYPSRPSLQTPLNLGNMTMSSIGNIGGTIKPTINTTLPSSSTLPSQSLSIREEVPQRSPIFDLPRLSQLKQTMDKITTKNNSIPENNVKYGKRKKTIRRTYKLGKSRITPKVSVLISNKTVRKNISTKTEKLKQIPIDEIRSILIKKGFIKVGSLATNDILRKMYESMLLVCGEVENHNPDNLLYNYFNV